MPLTLAQKNSIVDIYVGYFNRAPDPEGLQNYIKVYEARLAESTPENVITDKEILDTMASNFGNSDEAKDLYPFLVNPLVAGLEEFLNDVYQNLFNRAPDADGLKYWTDRINDPVNPLSPGVAIRKIAEGAEAESKDLAILDNKAIVAMDYVTKVANIPGFVFDKAAASAAIKDVDETDASVTAATAATDASLADGANNTGKTFTLTTDVDTPDATENNDTFQAVLEATDDLTFNTFDNVDGKGGTDTLNIAGAGAMDMPTGVTLAGIEIVNIATVGAVTNLNSSSFGDVEQLWQIGVAGNVTVGAGVTAGFRDVDATFTVTVADGVDAVSVALDGVDTGSAVAFAETTPGDLETVSVSGSVAGAGALTLTAVGTETTLNLGLTTDGEVTVATFVDVTDLNASNSTGDLTLDASLLVDLETFTGGSGSDTLTAVNGSATVDALAINAGAGTDTIEFDVTAVGTATATTLTGGDGGDTFELSGAGNLVAAADNDELLESLVSIADFVAAEDVIDTALITTGGLTAQNVVNNAITAAAPTNLFEAATAAAGVTNTVGVAGDYALFDYDGNAYIFADDGVAGFDAGDTLIEVAGISIADLTGANFITA
jgi:hypothetical protein